LELRLHDHRESGHFGTHGHTQRLRFVLHIPSSVRWEGACRPTEPAGRYARLGPLVALPVLLRSVSYFYGTDRPSPKLSRNY
jgi:hypothetical protein